MSPPPCVVLLFSRNSGGVDRVPPNLGSDFKDAGQTIIAKGTLHDFGDATYNTILRESALSDST